jgi:hypothetical protein
MTMLFAAVHESGIGTTDDYAMSALTEAIWGKPDQICSMRDFLRMTQSVFVLSLLLCPHSIASRSHQRSTRPRSS